jgi:hypothetical protein
MKIILIIQKENGEISHHHPIDEKKLSRVEKELANRGIKIIYRLYIKMSFSIQRAGISL